MKKKITACLACAALVCGMCGCSGGEDKSSADDETETVTTVTEASGTASETSVTTEAKTEKETSEATKNTEGLTVSPSGYVLDPNVTLGEHEYAYLFPENQPCFIDETAEGVRVYGVNTDTEREFHYLNPFEEHFSTTDCVVLEHDGIADEFAGCWSERFGTAMLVYSDDFDGDGEKEIATVRYDTGGTFCRVMELVVYKLNEGHYERFVFDEYEFIEEYITAEVDSENYIVNFSAKGSDKTFSYDFSEDFPDGGCDVIFGIINDFVIDGGEITYIATPHLSARGICTKVSISFKLKFSDGIFTCSDVEFIEEKPAGRLDDPEYAVDFDTAVSNIIAAGVEANNSKFVLSGTEDSDGETYYIITKGFDNGDKVVTEEIFRVSTENGSVYVLFDPTLPMSDYLAQFKSENDGNDPRSRYIQIYDGKS